MRCADNMIWEQFSQELQRYVRQQVQQDDLCKDILQDVYLKVYINISKLRNVENVRAYLYQVTRNAVVDHYRHRGRLPVEMEGEGQGQEPAHEMPVFKEEYRLADCLRVMIDGLPEIYRQALVLTELEGKTQKQFAEIMGISLSGAKSRVQRARAKLREEIIRCCEYEFDRYGNILSCCKENPPGRKYC